MATSASSATSGGPLAIVAPTEHGVTIPPLEMTGSEQQIDDNDGVQAKIQHPASLECESTMDTQLPTGKPTLQPRTVGHDGHADGAADPEAQSVPSGRVVNFQRFHEIANTTEIAVQQARKPGYGGVFRQPHDYCFKSAAASGGLGISTSYLLGLVPTVKYIHTF